MTEKKNKSKLQEIIDNHRLNNDKSDKRAQDILSLIRSRHVKTRKEDTRKRASEYDIFDIVQYAALEGVSFRDRFDLEPAEGIIRSNPTSMVIKVLDKIDKINEQNNE